MFDEEALIVNKILKFDFQCYERLMGIRQSDVVGLTSHDLVTNDLLFSGIMYFLYVTDIVAEREWTDLRVFLIDIITMTHVAMTIRFYHAPHKTSYTSLYYEVPRVFCSMSDSNTGCSHFFEDQTGKDELFSKLHSLLSILIEYFEKITDILNNFEKILQLIQHFLMKSNIFISGRFLSIFSCLYVHTCNAKKKFIEKCSCFIRTALDNYCICRHVIESINWRGPFM